MKYLYSIPGMAGAEWEEATFQGDWKAGKREGKGEMTWMDGARFKGVWRNDMRAEGEMRMTNGNIYIGGFDNDKFHGAGRLLLNTGLIFDGSFDHGICAPVGKLLYPNGDIYYGQHKGFVREG